MEKNFKLEITGVLKMDFRSDKVVKLLITFRDGSVSRDYPLTIFVKPENMDLLKMAAAFIKSGQACKVTCYSGNLNSFKSRSGNFVKETTTILNSIIAA